MRRSLEDSLERMGLDRIDILYLHDPDGYDLERGLPEGLPALAKLRDEGLVRAIGIGVNSADVAARAVREGDLDLVMIAGRYTLLEQPALSELLPLRGARRRRRGGRRVQLRPPRHQYPGPNARYNYGAVPPDVLARAERLGERAARPAWRCRRPHCNTRCSIRRSGRSCRIGARCRHPPEHRADAGDLPNDFWAALRAEGLIP